MTHPLQQALIDVCLGMAEAGINQGTAGNASARADEGYWITPSGRPYTDLRPADVLRIDRDGALLEGRGTPSTEWRMHVRILEARPDCQAVVHAHPRAATALACHRREIPAFHYMVAVAGGDSIRCARYETFGTDALARAALEALKDRQACLLANHGILALGRSPERALALAIEVEALAAQYAAAQQFGPPTLLTAEQMREVLDAFASYGA